MAAVRMTFGRKLAIAIDQLINVLAGGWPDETLSARCWRLHMSGIEWPRRVLNAIVWWQKDHCLSAFQNEKAHMQGPEEYRK